MSADVDVVQIDVAVFRKGESKTLMDFCFDMLHFIEKTVSGTWKLLNQERSKKSLTCTCTIDQRDSSERSSSFS